MERLLIVDGNNLLFQMFYGMPSKIYNKSGQTIHATIGFVSAMQRLIKLVDASFVVVVFDGDVNQERIDEYKDYKANRVNNWDELPSDEVPFNEEENIIKCLNFMGIKVLKSINMEADDLIASLTLSNCEDYKIYISSNDSDFYQLINDNVAIIKYKGKDSKIIDKNEFYNIFNFDSSKYVFYKSLVGDSADNIMGISGIGKVRATKIVSCCDSFKKLLEKKNELLPKKIASSLEDEMNKFFTNKKIIILTQSPIINYDIREFGYNKDIISLSNSQILTINRIFD